MSTIAADKLIDGVGNLDAIDLGGIVQAAGVFADAEDARTGVGRVAADAFKHRTAVAGYVRKDVDLGVVPVDHASVVPDFFGGFYHVSLYIARLRDAAGDIR